MANIPATQKQINAFNNPDANDRWIKALLKAAQPQIGSMQGTPYLQCMEILQANGIDTNIHNP